MLIKTTFDIQNRTPVYAICDPATERCGVITTNICNAIKAGQCKTFDEVKALIAK
jgi:hypothetical protein